MNTNRPLHLSNSFINMIVADRENLRSSPPDACLIGKIVIGLLLIIGVNARGDSESASSPEAALVSAAEQGNDQVIRRLMAVGVDINSKYTVRPQLSTDAIRELTAQGIDIKSRFVILTALTRAISRNHVSTVKLLLESGADPNLSSTSGTPLLMAITVSGSTEIIQMLLGHGANPNGAGNDKNKGPPIAILAALAKPSEGMQVEIVRELIKFGAAVDQPGARGASALTEAIDQGKLLLVRCLLEAGANPNKARDRKTLGFTDAEVPLQEAVTISASHRDLSMMRLLLDYGADPNYRNDRMHYDTDGPHSWWDGVSPLAAAAESGASSIAKVLLERGADPCLSRTDGASPYEIALKAGHPETSLLIMEHSAGQPCAKGKLPTPASNQ